MAAEGEGIVQSQGVTWAYLAQRELLLLRQTAGAGSLDLGASVASAPLASAHRALELANETARTLYPHERDYVRAHWLIGSAHCAAGDHDLAERHLHEALERCRRINLVTEEADILIDLARLHTAMGKMDEAKRCVEEALLITERSGYVTTKPASSSTSPGCIWPRGRRRKPSDALRRRCSSPSAAGMCCKARMRIWSWRSWRWHAGTRSRRRTMRSRQRSWPIVMGRRTTPTRPRMTKRGRCCARNGARNLFRSRLAGRMSRSGG